MQGLEVIEQIAVVGIPDSTNICLILGAFSILIPTSVVYYFTKNGNKALLAEFISGFTYIVLIGVLFSGKALEKPTGEYQYRVRITEDVGYIEFTDKYEVIAENDDGTYIIQEKDYIKE